jgi:hypothetical protein
MPIPALSAPMPQLCTHWQSPCMHASTLMATFVTLASFFPPCSKILGPALREDGCEGAPVCMRMPMPVRRHMVGSLLSRGHQMVDPLLGWAMAGRVAGCGWLRVGGWLTSRQCVHGGRGDWS